MQSKIIKKSIGVILLTLSFGGNLSVHGMDKANYSQKPVKLKFGQTCLPDSELDKDFWKLARSIQKSLDSLIDFFGERSVILKNKSLCVDTIQEELDSLKKRRIELLDLYHFHDEIVNKLIPELKELAKSTPKTRLIECTLQSIDSKVRESCDMRQTLEGDFCMYCELLNCDEKSLYDSEEMAYIQNFLDDVIIKVRSADKLILMCREKSIAITESINRWKNNKRRIVSIVDARLKEIPFDELVRCTQSLVDSVDALKGALYNSETYNSYASRLNNIEVVSSLAYRIREEYSRIMRERSYSFKEKSDYDYNLYLSEFLCENLYQMDKSYVIFTQVLEGLSYLLQSNKV